MGINVGLSDEQRAEISKLLSKLLANSYLLYIKSHNFHWNVQGPHFSEYHALFEAHYIDLAGAVDSIAERIRALGFAAPGSAKQFLELATVQEELSTLNAQQMLTKSLQDHEAMAVFIRQGCKVAADAGDEVTVGLLAERLAVHEKTAWMLRSYLNS